MEVFWNWVAKKQLNMANILKVSTLLKYLWAGFMDCLCLSFIFNLERYSSSYLSTLSSHTSPREQDSQFKMGNFNSVSFTIYLASIIFVIINGFHLMFGENKKDIVVNTLIDIEIPVFSYHLFKQVKGIPCLSLSENWSI